MVCRCCSCESGKTWTCRRCATGSSPTSTAAPGDRRIGAMTRPLLLVVSIDTEEDNWEPARTGTTVENIRELLVLDRFFERLGVRATYFTSYQVAVTPWSAELLRDLVPGGRAEIGAHLHPW